MILSRSHGCAHMHMHWHLNYKAMTYNEFVSHPLKWHLPMRADGYYLLCYYII